MGFVALVFRRLVLFTMIFLGTGFVMANLANAIILWYLRLQLSMSSSTQVAMICGTLFFIIASVIFMMLGVLVMIGGLYLFHWGLPNRLVYFGCLLGSLYLLCLGIGSSLMLSEMNLSSVLLIISSLLFMLGTAAYASPSFDFKLTGSVMGVVGGILLVIVLSSFRIFGSVFVGWDVQFPGPFMSMAFLEGIVLVLGSFAVFVKAIAARRKEGSAVRIFFPLIILVYAIGMIVGSLVLAFNLWDLLWKAPWLGPLHGAPDWVLNATVFWSSSLLMLSFGGLLLVLSSCFEFATVTKEVSLAKEVPEAIPTLPPTYASGAVASSERAEKS